MQLTNLPDKDVKYKQIYKGVRLVLIPVANCSSRHGPSGSSPRHSCTRLISGHTSCLA